MSFNKTTGFMGIALFVLVGVSGYQYYRSEQKDTNTNLKLVLSDAQAALLKDELAMVRSQLIEERSKPDYDTGYRDAILHMGGPQNPGSYQDGFRAAVKMLDNQTYADGYHAAIEQFGFQGTPIVPKLESSASK